MTPERWRKVEEVLQGALDRQPQQRAAFLNEVCSGDDELREEASSLIEAYDHAGEFIEEPAISRDAQVFVGICEERNVGRQIGPYKIVERLGGGGMGEVYLARDSRLDRLVALKILPPYFGWDDARLRRFQTEARAASALNHPNILTIHEVGQSEDLHYIATEYIDGQTIRELTQAENLSLGDVFDIANQLVSGLSAAHAAGIVHRDIKPENIMRRNDGVVKILDFGVAKLLEPASSTSSSLTASLIRAETEAGELIGTMTYMSPEQLRGLAVDERTDIWSCGVVLYEMLAQRHPFPGATRADTIVAILEREPASLFKGDGRRRGLRQLQDVVSKALNKDQTERYQTAAEMLSAVKAAQQQIETESTRGNRAAIGMLSSVGEVQELAGSPTSKVREYAILIGCILLVLIFAGAFVYERVVTGHWPGSPANPTAATKLYTQMSPAEQLAFVNEQEQRISSMMGEGPVKLSDEALRTIKRYVDRYADRTNSATTKPGVDPLRTIYGRARPYVPVISGAFAERRIPIIVGIYLPMIESEYKPCYENSNGAKGLFQFIPQTAEQYGVARADMCDVEKMAPAAAHYIADSMAELGDDSQSMTLVLLSYNRGADGVRDSLRFLRETDAKFERNFWTLFNNRDKLDESFRRESAGYVPVFFAAAIVGENPDAFDLHMPALSSLANVSTGRKP